MGKAIKMSIQISETMRIPIIRCEGDLSPDMVNSNNNNNNTSFASQDNGDRKLDLPIPSFRPASNYLYRKRTHTARKAKKRPDSYYHYDEPDAETLDKMVEYDMDLEDIAWLEKFNRVEGESDGFDVTEQEFEKIMDRLEKESYFDNQQNGNPIVPVDEDAVCAICQDGECSNANVILFCDMCDLAVHQECYGVPYIPEGQWLCRRCLNSPLRTVDCVLCPNVDGAFKQTDENRWAHVVCALWIPEVNFANTVFLEPIENIKNIERARWKLVCYICKQRTGACIQCCKRDCLTAFHITCAQQAKLYMKISQCTYDSPNGGSFEDVKKEAFCDKHTPKDAEASRGMYSGDETDEDVSTVDYRRKHDKRKKQLKQTRKLLASKREEMQNSHKISIKVDRPKLLEISKCFGSRGRKNLEPKQFEALRFNYVEKIHGYWTRKRDSRNGVPLLRRLQIASYQNVDPQPDEKLDKNNFERLRYDLERCRLLLGECKKREQMKKKIFMVNAEIITKQLDLIDYNDPPHD